MIAAVEPAPVSCEEAARFQAESLGTSIEEVRKHRHSRSKSRVATRHAMIRALFEGMYRICEIAAVMRLHHATIHYVLRHGKKSVPVYGNGFPRLIAAPYRIRSARVVKARAELAAALRQEGLSWAEVAAASGYATHVGAMEAVERISGQLVG